MFELQKQSNLRRVMCNNYWVEQIVKAKSRKKAEEIAFKNVWNVLSYKLDGEFKLSNFEAYKLEAVVEIPETL